MSVSEAYDKMFKNGLAFKPIKIAQPTPDNPEGSVGSPINKNKKNDINENNWSEFDSKMRSYVENKKKTKTTITESSKIKKLEKRIDLLEGIIEKIMKTQMEILKNG